MAGGGLNKADDDAVAVQGVPTAASPSSTAALITYTEDGNDRCLDTRVCNEIQVSPVTSSNTVPECNPFKLNGTGTKEMDTNGATGNDIFRWEPSSNVYYLTSFGFLIQDPGSSDVNDFGSISGGLSNGLLIEVQSNGTLYTIMNLQDNGDIVTCLTGQTGLSGDDSNGFLDSADTFFGQYVFPGNAWPIIDSAQGDFIRATVRDDLTPLSFLRMSANAVRVV